MKIEFTDDTRPSKCCGVKTCSSVDRITTLTMSSIPLAASSATDRANDRESANPMIVSPKPATAMNSDLPARFIGGRCVNTSDIATAPAAGAACMSPSPCGPT